VSLKVVLCERWRMVAFWSRSSGEASNHLMPRWLKTVVVSDEERAPEEASDGDQEDERE
jgi:hypothetical protein